MCMQCIVNPLYWYDVLPGWTLIRARRKDDGEMNVGDWGLVTINDPDFIWKSTPKMDPKFEMTEEEEDKFWDQNPDYDSMLPDDFLDAFDNSSVMTSWELVDAAIKAGYNQEKHGCDVKNWLFHYLACWIRDHEPTVEEDPFPNLDGMVEHNYDLGKE